ncbi:MAG: hypothetical protein IT343_02060 [Candidatus Melainabacteria bacterium]|jgi:hypothetical protein|nr:hypothetical protein [Candidatus Melainabacteria bacterium]
MPAAITVFPNKTCLTACFSIVVISLSGASAIDNICKTIFQNKSATVSEYDCNIPVDEQTAIDFTKFWATRALNFDTTGSEKLHQESTRWMADTAMAEKLKKTFWLGHDSAPIVKGQVVSVTDAVLFDRKTAGVELIVHLTRAGRGTERIPVLMHVVVSKEQDGYRVQGFQVDYFHDRAASLICGQFSRTHLLVHDGPEKGTVQKRNQASRILNSFDADSYYAQEATFFIECVVSALDN